MKQFKYIFVLIILIISPLIYGLYEFRSPLKNVKTGDWTANRLAFINGVNEVNSTNLYDWVSGTASEIDITDDLDGTITIGLIDPLAVLKGGTGQSTYTNGQLLIGNTTGNTLTKSALTGTTNRIIITNGTGSITISTPQDINTISSPRFARLYIDDVNTYLDRDGSYNLTFTDSISGTQTLAALLGGGGGTDVNCFTTITGITNNVVADANNDTLTLASANARLTIVGTTASDTITYTVDTDLNNYSWSNVNAADLKVGSITQAYDADLADLADGSLTASKVAGVADADYGDVTVSGGTWSVENDSHNHTASTISGLTIADFSDANISQWTNDSGYLTAFSETDPCYALLTVVDLLTFSANVIDANTASISNGDTKHLATNDQIYDFVVGLGYITDLSTFDTDDLNEGLSNKYDQTVVLTEGNDIEIDGTYPNFTISSTVVGGSETDPCWTAWLAVPPNISIFTNDSGYITTWAETDPCLIGHLVAYDHNDIADGETAYGWGDHSLAGYLTAEVDPCLALLDINSTDVTSWTSAYGWGDHSLVGYLTTVDISDNTNLAVVDLLTLTDDTLDANTATPANGDTKHLSTGDQIYDFVIGLGYIDAETDPCFVALNNDDDVSATELDDVFSSNGFLIRTGAATYSIDTNTYSETTHNHSGTYQPADAQLDDIAGADITKGRILVADGSNWKAFAIGNDDEVLTADSGEPNGVKWAAGGGSGTPAGSDGYVQYNNSGAFGGEATLTYNDSTNTFNPEDVNIAKTAFFTAEYDNGNSDLNDTINWTNGNKQKITLIADCNLTFTNPAGACNPILRVIQDGTGGWDVNWPTLATADPTVAITASVSTVVAFYFDGTNYYSGGGVKTEGTGQTRDYLLYRDVKADTTVGGTFTSGAWRTRDITEETIDTGDNGSLAANQITLAAGTYECHITVPAFCVNAHQARLYNVTDSAVMNYGTTENMTTSSSIQTHSVIIYRFSFATSHIIRIEHRCETTNADNGFGEPASFGGEEVYTLAMFQRVN